MTQRDDTISFRQMLDHAREVVTLTKDRTRADLDTDRVWCLALTRLVEIIGEAANRVSTECKERTSQIPWGSIIGLRNRLIHGYDTINHDILWQILSSDLPLLIESLENMVDAENH